MNPRDPKSELDRLLEATRDSSRPEAVSSRRARGYRKELEAESNPEKREALFDRLIGELYQKGHAIEAATHLEIDTVIDPADTRRVVGRAFSAACR